MNDAGKNIIRLIKLTQESLDTLGSIVMKNRHSEDKFDINQAMLEISTTSAQIFFCGQHLQLAADVGKRPANITRPCDSCATPVPEGEHCGYGEDYLCPDCFVPAASPEDIDYAMSLDPHAVRGDPGWTDPNIVEATTSGLEHAMAADPQVREVRETSPKDGVSLHKDGTWHPLKCGGIFEGPFDSQDEAEDHIECELPGSHQRRAARSKPKVVFNPTDHTWDVEWYIEVMDAAEEAAIRDGEA